MGVNINQIETVGGENYRLNSLLSGKWGVIQTSESQTVAFVDPINGDNTNAALGDILRPFKDPWAAKDVIETKPTTNSYVVNWLPGEYTVGDDVSNLKVTADSSDGNLQSTTHFIHHNLQSGAILKAVSSAVQFTIFDVVNDIPVNISGKGSIIHDEGNAAGCKLISIAEGWEGDVNIEASSISVSKGIGSSSSYIDVRGDNDITIKSNLTVSDFKLIKYITSGTKLTLGGSLDLDLKITGQQNDLITFTGLDDGTRGFENFNLNAIINNSTLNGTGPIFNFYRTKWENSNVEIQLKNTDITRSELNSSLVRLNEGLATNSNIDVKIDNIIFDTDYLIDLNLTSSNIVSHPVNEAIVSIKFKNVTYNLHGSYVNQALILYNSFEDVPGLKVISDIDGVFEDRVLFHFKNNQNITINGNITTTGTTSPFILDEVLTQGITADYDFKILLKNLYVETPDAVDAININSFTGSKILTSNYETRSTVTIETL